MSSDLIGGNLTLDLNQPIKRADFRLDAFSADTMLIKLYATGPKCVKIILISFKGKVKIAKIILLRQKISIKRCYRVIKDCLSWQLRTFFYSAVYNTAAGYVLWVYLTIV
jgi:hypothetical protein